MPKIQITPALQYRGWVLREQERNSAPIIVRGARREDNPLDYQRGFVYVETLEEAEEYDRNHAYA